MTESLRELDRKVRILRFLEGALEVQVDFLLLL